MHEPGSNSSRSDQKEIGGQQPKIRMLTVNCQAVSHFRLSSQQINEMLGWYGKECLMDASGRESRTNGLGLFWKTPLSELSTCNIKLSSQITKLRLANIFVSWRYVNCMSEWMWFFSTSEINKTLPLLYLSVLCYLLDKVSYFLG